MGVLKWVIFSDRHHDIGEEMKLCSILNGPGIYVLHIFDDVVVGISSISGNGPLTRQNESCRGQLRLMFI